MPLLDIEEQLFVCEPSKTTVQIRVKNVGVESLRLWDVYPIGDSRDHIQVKFCKEPIPPNGSIDITVTIKDHCGPTEIKFDTNCPRTGKVIYVLRSKHCEGPNLWLFPAEKYNKDRVFFPDPKPSLQLPVIVQSTEDSPVEFDLCNIKLSSGDGCEKPCDPDEIVVSCEKTKRKTSFPGDNRYYKILNSADTHQVHSICIDFPECVIRDRTVAQEIQLTICTNSKLPELEKQEVSIQLAGFEVTPVEKIGLWSKWRKKKRVELEIQNSETYPLRIFNFRTDLTKIKVKDIEADGERVEVDHPIVIKPGESKKFGVQIRSSLLEWLWSGTELKKISVPICANAGPDPKESYVFADKSKIEGLLILGPLSLLILLLCILLLCLCWFHDEQMDTEQDTERKVIISSYPLGETIRVNRKKVGITPMRLQVKEKADIQIGHSNRRRVKDVIDEGTIFFSNSKWKVNKRESK